HARPNARGAIRRATALAERRPHRRARHSRRGVDSLVDLRALRRCGADHRRAGRGSRRGTGPPAEVSLVVLLGGVRSGKSARAVAAGRSGLTVAVSNEVGLGIVPATPSGRRYRDVLGRVNAAWVEASREAFFVVAGRALPLR